MNKLPLIKPLIKTNEFDDCFITSITDNSKDVLENSLFVARQGEGSHGKKFIKEAIKNGASCIISDQKLQEEVFSILGFSKKEAFDQFGFLLNAFNYGAPPHGGIAFGLDRLAAVMKGEESIRDYIAFPKNNSGRDVMIDSPSIIDKSQLDDLNIKIK